ncbi:hypothetical protein BDV95DRAFT_614461 [Massariosphaeria phaeospora]|uniref:Actin cortical patch SUR7/pH-response regulator PalI n=1 Tax=Massariosphaeria phaeospora TaxID=100035 RepID=A0A7C8MIK2_9PLEO|nr:hypothetical protein BDV95DRAFT_614461 [Massariosphaeria phaeospora]
MAWKNNKRSPKNTSKKSSAKGRSLGKTIFTLVASLSFFSSLLLGIMIPLGCISSSWTVKPLHVAELRTATTYNASLQIGYFGGCLTVSKQDGGPSISHNNTASASQTHCLLNLHDKDIEDLTTELHEDLDLTPQTHDFLTAYLNETLPLSRHFQRNVFRYQPPVASVILLTISGAMLFFGATNTSAKRSYKIVLLIAILLSGFAIALVSAVAFGSQMALNALTGGDENMKERWLWGDLSVHRAERLQSVQWALFGLVILFYIAIGGMYTQTTGKGRGDEEKGLHGAVGSTGSGAKANIVIM